MITSSLQTNLLSKADLKAGLDAAEERKYGKAIVQKKAILFEQLAIAVLGVSHKRLGRR